MKIEWVQSDSYETAALGLEAAQGPHLHEIIPAALRTENMVASWLSSRSFDSDEADVEGFNPYDGLEDEYMMFSDSFRDVRSPDQLAMRKAKIDKEIADRRLLAEAGWVGYGWQVAAGILDPMTLPLVVVPIARVGQGALRVATTTAAVGAAEAAIVEGGLHSTQETRTINESLLAIGGTAIVGGILGGIAGVSARRIEDAADNTRNYVQQVIESDGFDNIDDVPSVGAMAVEDFADGSGIGYVGWRFTPITRGLTAQAEGARVATNLMYPHNFATDANRAGIAASNAGDNVEIKVLNDQDRFSGQLAEALDSNYKAYTESSLMLTARLKGRFSEKITYAQFSEEVGKAMNRGDAHSIPEVDKAAKSLRPILDEVKRHFQDLGDLPQHLKTKYAQSYFPRIFDIKKIEADRNGFSSLLVSHYTKKIGDEDAAREIASQIIDNIEGQHISLMPTDDIVPSSPFLKERVLDIDDELLEPFLVRNVEQVMHTYLRSTLPEIHIRKNFGQVEQRRLAAGKMGPPEPQVTPLQRTINAVIGEVNDDYNSLMAATKSPDKLKKLTAERKVILDDLKAGFELLTNRYMLPRAEHKQLANLANIMRGLTFMTNLGMMTIAAIPDLSRLMMQHGLKPFVRAMPAAFTQFVGEASKMARRDLERMGFALDTVTSGRAYAIADVDEFGTVMERWTRRFAQFTGMNHWNKELKLVAGMIGQDEFIRQSMRFDKLSKRQRTRLLKAGIDEDAARRIVEEFEKHGDTIKNLKHAKTMEWDDQALARKFERILHQDVINTIVTPSRGDKPLLFSTQTGRTVFQFKSFLVAAHNKVLLPIAKDMQHKDFTALSGVLTGAGLGMMVEYVRMNMAGRGEELESYSPGDWARAAIDRSGLATVPMEGFNFVDRVTHGRLSGMMGLQEGSRYFYRNAWGSWLGPTAGYTEDAVTVIQRLVRDGDFTASDAAKIRKLIPYQNLFYIRQLLNQIQEGAIDYYELEDNRRQR